MSCRPTGGRTGPRTLPGHHTNPCPNPATCRGCQPCPERHCTICHRAHVQQQTCPTCTATMRTNLHTIQAAVQDLLAESLRRNTISRTGPLSYMPGGEAAYLIGPAANLEAWGYKATSSRDHHKADGEPLLLTLDSWANNWREELHHPPTDLQPTISRTVAYLTQHLTHAAQHHWAIDRFAKDIQHTVTTIEAVLHSGDRDDPAGVACFDCNGQLVRRMTPTGISDNWTCRTCRRSYTDPEYHLAVRAKIERATA